MKLLNLITGLILFSTTLFAEAEIGKPAPAFALRSSEGTLVRSDDLKGKYVVLEWYNPECPFIKKHYLSGNMQSLQKKYTAKGVQWYSVNSSAPGRQGNLNEESAKKLIAENNSAQSAILFDPDGQVGKQYEARTTPHMFVIDPKGILIYAGAIDNNSSPDPAKIPSSTNYVSQALDQAMSGKTVTEPSTEPYGCAVKYG